MDMILPLMPTVCTIKIGLKGSPTPVLPCVTFLSGSFLPSLTRVFIALGRFQSRVIVSQF